MGLDMYLRGEKYRLTDYKNPKNNLIEDGFKVHSTILELGYWRKHPDLHGYIVQTFAEGKDECQRIPLSDEGMELICLSINSKKLPHTEGFFFGSSYNNEAERAEAIAIFRKAIEWVKTREKNISRDVYYQASW